MQSDVKELCKKLKPVLGKKIDALWRSYITEDADGKREVETILNILAAKTLNESYDSSQILLSPPTREAAAGEYPIGTVFYNGRGLFPFGLREDEWIQHLALFGRSGAGKTNIVFRLIDDLLEAKKPFLIFDWKRNYRDLLANHNDAELLVFTVGRSIAPIRFNPLIPPEGTDPKTWLKKMIEIIAITYYLGEGVKYLLQRAIDAVYKEFGVYKEQPEQWPTMADVLKWLEGYNAKGREAGWMVSTLRAVHVLCFGEMGKVINVRQQVGLQKLLEKNVVLELDSLTNTDKTFFIQTLLLWIHHYRLAEGRREEFKHAIIIEEAHHVLLKQEHSTESVIDIVLREIRELGTAIILVDQHPSMISKVALGNTYTTITMNLKASDDVRAAASYTLLDRDQAKFFGQLAVGEAIVKLQGRCFMPFLMKIPLVRVPKGTVTDDAIREKVRSDSAYSAVMSAVDTDTDTLEAIPVPDKEEESETEKALLIDIAKNPLSGTAGRYRRLDTSGRHGNAAQQSLIERGLIRKEALGTKTGRTVLLGLTEEGTARARQLGLPMKEKSRPASLEHEYWKEKVAELMEEKGYSVEREKKIGDGKAIDIEVKTGDKVFAIEIETGRSDAIKNIEKDLAAGAEYVLTIATSAAAEAQIKEKLAKKELEDPEKVRLLSVASLGF